MRLLPAILFSSTLLFFSACTDLDQQQNIKDLRVIAVINEPPEVIASFNHIFSRLPLGEGVPRLPFFPETEVNTEIIAFDPRGGQIEVLVQSCPAPVGNACERFNPERVFERFKDGYDDTLEDFFRPRIFRREMNEEKLKDNPLGMIPELKNSYQFSRSVIDTALQSESNFDNFSPFALFDRLFNQYLYLGIRAQNLSIEDGEVKEELAIKRIPVNIDPHDPLLLPFLEEEDENGQQLISLFIENTKMCPLPDEEDFVEGLTDCVYPRFRNQNPILIGFNRLSREDDPARNSSEIRKLTSVFIDDKADLERISIAQAKAGDRILLRPVFAEGVLEQYQSFRIDPNNSKLEIVNRREDLASNLYISRGSAPFLVAPQFDGNLDFAWQLPENAQSGETDTLFMIIRDQRGGATWAQLIIEYN